MNRLLLCFLIFCLMSSISRDIFAQTKWEYVKGEGYDKRNPIWGNYNQAHPYSQPGYRKQAATWTYNGSLYLFGGGDATVTPTSTPLVFLKSGYNDVWKFDVSINQWILLKGPKMEDDTGHFEVLGLEHPNNRPSARRLITHWQIDSFLYVYSGDMWRYNMNSNNWACISVGPQNANAPVYGSQQGVPSSNIFPGMRTGACSWVSGNKLYLFGGKSPDGYLGAPKNDIWRYDLSTHLWEWMKGGSGAQNNQNVSALNVESSTNRPKAKGSAIHAVFGSLVYIYGEHDEVWKYDMQTNNWTALYMELPSVYGQTSQQYRSTARYGQQGVFHMNNTPGERTGVIGWTENGRLLLYGGATSYQVSYTYWDKTYNDIWEFDTSLLQWRYLKGDVVANQYIRFTDKYVEYTTNTPGGRQQMLFWNLGNNIYIANGIGMASSKVSGNFAIFSGPLSDVWKFNKLSRNWSWIHGTVNANKKFVLHATDEDHMENRPEPVSIYLTGGNNFYWKNDTDMYIYGSSDGKYYSNLNDSFVGSSPYWKNSSKDAVWKYSSVKNAWSLIKANTNDIWVSTFNAGTQNVYNANNTPGTRKRGMTWSVGNKLYLFGGEKNEPETVNGNAYDSLMNDVWEFDLLIKQWRRIKGDIVYNVIGNYGTVNQASISNQPSSRRNAATWSVGNKLYMFGGWGIAANGQYGTLNDLWEFDLSSQNWTWKGGTSSTYQATNFSPIGVPSATAWPGSRERVHSWTLDNKLYMYSGIGRIPSSFPTNSEYLHELWVYDTTNGLWTLLKGVYTSNDYSYYNYAIYGIKGVESPTNRAPALLNAGTTVSNGRLLLYGGYGSGECNTCGGSKDNLWSYNPQTNAWTWLEGNKDVYMSYQEYPESPTLNSQSVIPNPGGGSAAPKGWAFNGYFYTLNEITTWETANMDIWRFPLCSEPAVGCSLSTILPIVNIGNDTVICNAVPISLNAGNIGYKYLWSTNDTTQTIVATQPGTYWVKVTDANNNSIFATDTIQIQHQTAPIVPFAGGNIILCGSQSTTLNAQNNGSTYLWNTGSTQQSITVDTTGTYSVTITNSNGCVTNTSIGVLQVTKPVVVLGNDTGYCNWTGSDSFLLVPQNVWNFPNNNTFLWSNNATTTSIYAKQTGTYSLTVSDVYGCSSTDSIHITLDTIIPMNLDNNAVICDGVPLVLDATTPGLMNYTWLYGGVNSPQLTVTFPNNYLVSAFTAFGCISNSNVLVTGGNSTPFSLGSDSALCSIGDSVVLNAYHPNATYSWSNGSTDSAIVVTTPGLYSCVLTNQSGCSTTRQITIVADTPIVFSLGNDTTICSNDSIVLNAFNVGSTYQWSTGSTSASILANQVGTYTCELSSPFGCVSSSSINISHLPILEPISSPMQVQINGNTVNVMVSNLQNTDSIRWEFGDGNSSTQMTASNTYSQNGSYLLKLHLYNQCFDMIFEYNVLIDTPTSIYNVDMKANGIHIYPNPTHDEIIVNSLHENIKTIKIFNLLGQEVYSSNKGNLSTTSENISHLNDGTYLILVETVNNKYVSKFLKLSK